MKRKIPLVLAASLVAAAGLSGMSYAKGGNGNGGGHGGADHGGGHGASADAHSASGFAPGQTKASGENASAYAPGQLKQDDSAAAYAPGSVKKATQEDADAALADVTTADEDTGGKAKANFGTLISSIRDSKANLDGIGATATVSVVDVKDLMRGNNRVALENALADNQSRITDLRADLAALNLPSLQTQDVDQAVGVAAAKNGSLTVFVDRTQ